MIHSHLPVTAMFRCRIDPGAVPKMIDFFKIDGGEGAVGVYEIEQDRLKICLTGNAGLPERAQRRPTTFSVKAGNSWLVPPNVSRSRGH